MGSGAVPLGWPAPEPRPHVKICGLNDPADAAHAVAHGATMIGVVHFERSPRHVGAAVMREVGDAVAGGAMLVLLSVDSSDRDLDYLVEKARPDALQLHGREDDARIAFLAERYDLPVARAVGVATADDLATLPTADALLLLDAKPPKDADRPGGLGTAFDWSLLGAVEGRPYMLSGGLTPETVAEAARTARPYAVDVSSGVETNGRKDRAKIAAFCRAARAG